VGRQKLQAAQIVGLVFKPRYLDRNTGKTPGTGAFFVWCGAAEYDSGYA
jgi:hypothetical protein